MAIARSSLGVWGTPGISINLYVVLGLQDIDVVPPVCNSLPQPLPIHLSRMLIRCDGIGVLLGINEGFFL